MNVTLLLVLSTIVALAPVNGDPPRALPATLSFLEHARGRDDADLVWDTMHAALAEEHVCNRLQSNLRK